MAARQRMRMGTPLFIGLMSGTSLDGVDGVLVDFSGAAPKVLQHGYSAFDAAFAAELLALNSPSGNEIHRAALAANALARAYAGVVQGLLERAAVNPEAVHAIGAHGQTVRHRPQEFDGCGYTVQLNNPALLAELTGIDVVADFRSRDVAAGGQGAPLVPAFHHDLFGRLPQRPCVLNIGGISNLTVLPDGGATHTDGLLGFDCGPGNALMDFWCQRHTGQRFDQDGTWADSGNVVHGQLLQQLLAEPYLAKAPPKSTGRDLFNPDWLSAQLQGHADLPPADVQATLCAFTARVCANDLLRHAPDTELLVVCGGGALNASLMRRLQDMLAAGRGAVIDRPWPAAAAGGGGRFRLAGAQDHVAGNGQLEKRNGRPRRPCSGGDLPPLMPPQAAGKRSGREARPATAGGGGVRVLDDELGALQVFLVVDLGAHQILVAHGVDQQRHAVLGHRRVVFVGDFVEGEAVLEAGTTATLHKNAQFEFGVALFGDQVRHLGRRAVGEQDRIRHVGRQGFGYCAHGRLRLKETCPIVTQQADFSSYLLFAASFSVGLSSFAFIGCIWPEIVAPWCISSAR